MISVRKLKKSFHEVEVLKGIDVEIDKGEVVCVIGPSGSGKPPFYGALIFLKNRRVDKFYLKVMTLQILK